jgi:glycine cleavage system H protein
VYPDNVRYTAEHEWVRGDADSSETAVRIGVTDHAQEALGDIVFVSLPDLGDEVTAGEPCGEIESTKSVSDIYAPVSGIIAARNETLEAAPEMVNADPYGDGWLVEIRPSVPEQLEDLLDVDTYVASLDG